MQIHNLPRMKPFQNGIAITSAKIKCMQQQLGLEAMAGVYAPLLGHGVRQMVRSVLQYKEALKLGT